MKSFIWIFALLPLVGVGLFLFSSQSDPVMSPSSARLQADKNHRLAEVNSLNDQQDQIRQQSAEKVKALQEKIESLQDQANNIAEKAAQSAKYFTPDVQKRMVDNRMLYRESRYRALFGSWGLNANTSEKALALIREREAELIALQFEYAQQGAAGNLKSYQKERFIAETASGAYLADLLGKERFDELNELESKIRSEAIATAKKLRDGND